MNPTPATPAPTGFGSVTAAPALPATFAGTFASRYVEAGAVRLHAVTGGDGPPLLLVAGWPQTWYAWRHLMPALAEDFTVIAIEPRGIGLSDRPRDGYDTGTLARDLVDAMAALGHDRFAMVGHDVGMWIAYALAADHPNLLEWLVVAEAAIPGVSPSPPLMGHSSVNDRLWHFGFNRLDGLNEELVHGRERLFFGHQFATKAATPDALPQHAVDHYVETLARDRDALRASFGPYRAIDETIAQNERRKATRLTLPVLTIAGAENSGDLVEATMRAVADDVTSVVLPDTGHYPAEERPEAMLAAIRAFREHLEHPGPIGTI